MKIVIPGGTGFIGRHLCRELVNRDHDVTALSRSRNKEVVPSDVSIAQGDVTDYDSLIQVFQDMDAVINLVALSPLFKPKGGIVMHDRVHRGGTQNIVRAAEETGVKTIVQLSGIHADPDGPTAYIRSKGAAEQLIRDSELDWVIFRPTVIFGEGDEFTGFIKKVAPPYITPLPGGGKTRFQVLWVGDFIPMIADSLEDTAHHGKIYEVGGPDVLTLAEVAELVHAADGRSSRVLPIPMVLAGVGMTLGQYLPGFPFGPDQYRSLALDLVIQDNDVSEFDVQPNDLMRFREYLGLDEN